MLRALRLVLICLMVAAVPLKGLAAALMIGCGPSHHAAQAAALGERMHAVDTRADHEHARQTAAHAADAQAVQQTASQGDDTGSLLQRADKDVHAANATCSSCAPCCAAAAPASQPPALPNAPPSSDAPIGAVEQRSSITAGVPFKPPRFFLA